MSDVDLATLHKYRLDQRIKYELSDVGWVNRRKPKSVVSRRTSGCETVIDRNLRESSCGCCCAGGYDDDYVCDNRVTVAGRCPGQRLLRDLESAKSETDKRKVGRNGTMSDLHDQNCDENGNRGGDKEAYLTRRRSGTWP